MFTSIPLIHYAIIIKKLNLLQFFLQSGFDVEIICSDWAPLHTAVFMGSPEFVDMLLFYKAKVDVLNEISIYFILHSCFFNIIYQTPLIMAILNNDVEIAKSLLRAGSKVDDSPYPLHCAIQQDNLEMVKLLLLFGADPYLQARNGQTAFDIVTPIQKRIIEALKTIKKSSNEIVKQKIEIFQPPVSTLSDLLDRLAPPPRRKPDLSTFSEL